MKSENQVAMEFRKIKADYAYDADIICEDEERLSKVKEIIDTKLSLADKTIIILYADCMSYRKLGTRLGVSHMTIRRDVQRIKRIILEEYGKLSPNKRGCAEDE